MHICLFDIDGTLLNTGGAGQAAMEVALEVEFGVTARTEGISTAGRTDRAITTDMFRYHGIDGSEENRMQFISRYLKQLTTALQESDGLVLPGVPSLLDALSERSDVLLGLLTGNLQAGAQLKLTHFNLDHHFRFGGYGDHRLERNDVARDAIKEVHRECNGNFELDRVWVIGDTPADIECGRAVGANVVAVGTGLYSMETLRSAEPDWLFEDFSDSAEFLDLLK